MSWPDAPRPPPGFPPPPAPVPQWRERGRVLGLRSRTIEENGPRWIDLTATLATGQAQTTRAPVMSGVVRAWWKIVSVKTAPATSNPPRVRVAWSVQDEGAAGNLLNDTAANVSDPESAVQAPELLFDAWQGQVEIAGCTSAQIQAGFAPDDTVTSGGKWTIMATLTEGGTGAPEYGTFTRPVNIALAAAPLTVRIPRATALVNNGASAVRSFTWHNPTAQDVTITVTDFAGSAVDFIRPRAAAASLPYGPLEWLLDPSAVSLTIDSGGAAVANARVVFRYFP